MKKKFIIPLVLILLSLPTLLPFFSGKFFYTQDHIFVARLHQMSAALMSGQFPVRWAPDLRYGEPLFNFYAPLPYYFGVPISLVFNFIQTAKILFILASIFSAFTMYLFCRKLFSKEGALLATALYTYAPYRAVDIYVRGALSEAWAFVFFPLIFYSSLLLSERFNWKRILFLAISLSGLFLTHNVTAIMLLPFLLFFWLYLILKTKNWKIIFSFIISTVFSLGLSAFFLLPALFERQFIQTKYLLVGYFNFRAHFVAYKQLFSTFWGYGSSLWGPDDGLSFQIGIVHWIVLGIAILTGYFLRKNKKTLIFLTFLVLSFVFSIFLQHNKSAFIWEAIPLMAFIQFPWRFLAISVFIVSVSGGLVADYFKDRFKVVYIILILMDVLFNFSYFRPKEYKDESFFDKFTNIERMQKGEDLTKDYLPIWVLSTEGERFNAPRAEKGEIKVSDLTTSSTKLNFSVQVFSDSLIEVPINYFPGWEVKVNNRIYPQNAPVENGLIRFELSEGNYKIDIDFKDTLIRKAGNIVTMSFILIGAILFLRQYKLR